MIRKSAKELPELVDGKSQKLLALTKTHGLHTAYVCWYDREFDPDSRPAWQTACSSGWSLQESDVLWWVYAGDAKRMIEESGE